MKANLFQKYLTPSGLSEKDLSKGTDDIVFVLKINDVEIGTLSLKNKNWYFEYSDEFKKQKEFKPLTEFPDLNKTYESDRLWPFFLSRLPGLNNMPENLQKRNKINLAELLKNYGRKTTTNPYILLPG